MTSVLWDAGALPSQGAFPGCAHPRAAMKADRASVPLKSVSVWLHFGVGACIWQR